MSSAEIAAYIMVGLTLAYGIIFIIILPILRRILVRKEQTKREQFLNNLKIGAKVILIGGIYGQIVTINRTYCDIQVQDGVTIRFDRNAIVGKQK